MEKKIKIGLIGLVLICMVIIGVRLFSQNQTIPTDINRCIDELESKNYDYVPGSIIICFDEKFLEKEIREIMNGYNLDVKEYWSINNCVHVEVPTGSEFEWICKLKKDKRVKYAEPNLQSKISEKPIQPPEQDSKEFKLMKADRYSNVGHCSIIDIKNLIENLSARGYEIKEVVSISWALPCEAVGVCDGASYYILTNYPKDNLTWGPFLGKFQSRQGCQFMDTKENINQLLISAKNLCDEKEGRSSGYFRCKCEKNTCKAIKGVRCRPVKEGCVCEEYLPSNILCE